MRKFFLVLLLCFFISAEGINTYYDLAKKYVDKEGDCYAIVNAYLRDLYNDESFKFHRYQYEIVEKENATPGDVIFYQNGGLDTTHWAVYLGDNLALQGNYLGQAKIASIYLNNATSPIFYHLVSRNKMVMHFELIKID